MTATHRLPTPLATLVAFVVALTALPAAAQVADKELVPDEAVAPEAEASGWRAFMKAGASANFDHNSKVVGQLDGASTTMGLSLNSEGGYKKGQHAWWSTLSVVESVSRTPAIDGFVKSGDSLVLDTEYLYRIESMPWLGPFVRAGLATALFAGYDHRGSTVDYAGAVDEKQKTKLRLTDPFSPLRLKQSAGVFAKPYEEKAATLTFRVGAGAREVFADGQLAVSDDDATEDVIEVIKLDSYQQVGAEVAAILEGKLHSDKVSYKLGGELLLPFVTHPEDPEDRGVMELANVEAYFELGFQLVEWASLNYQIKARREPRLIDELQLENHLLLTFGTTLFDTGE